MITEPIQLTDEHLFQVHEFCIKCKKLNYVNNQSLESMKWKWNKVTWFGHFIEDKIVSLSGVHDFLDGYRVMFRGATLPGVSNKFLNVDQAHVQMNYINNIHDKSIFYFTLNVSNNTGSKSNRLRKWVHTGRCWPGSAYIRTQEIYGVDQEIWKI
mgnify:CR=1 FL=1|jgi:hypothetical protein